MVNFSKPKSKQISSLCKPSFVFQNFRQSLGIDYTISGSFCKFVILVPDGNNSLFQSLKSCAHFRLYFMWDSCLDNFLTILKLLYHFLKTLFELFKRNGKEQVCMKMPCHKDMRSSRLSEPRDWLHRCICCHYLFPSRDGLNVRTKARWSPKYFLRVLDHVINDPFCSFSHIPYMTLVLALDQEMEEFLSKSTVFPLSCSAIVLFLCQLYAISSTCASLVKSSFLEDLSTILAIASNSICTKEVLISTPEQYKSFLFSHLLCNGIDSLFF